MSLGNIISDVFNGTVVGQAIQDAKERRLNSDVERKYKQAQLEDALAQAEQRRRSVTPVGTLSNLPSPEEENAAKQSFMDKINQAKTTAGTGQEPNLSAPPAAPTVPFISQREEFAKRYPNLNPNLNLGENVQAATVYKSTNPNTVDVLDANGNKIGEAPKGSIPVKPQAGPKVPILKSKAIEILKAGGTLPENYVTVDDIGGEGKTNTAKSRIIEQFNKNPAIIKANQSLDAAKTIEDLVNSGNPIAAAAVPTYAARMSGEVGNLSEPDKAPFGGSQAVLEKLQASLQQMSTGQLSEDNKNFILGLTDLIKNRAQDNIKNHAKQFALQYGKQGTFGKPEEIYSMLNPDMPNFNPENNGAATPINPPHPSQVNPAKKYAGPLEVKKDVAAGKLSKADAANILKTQFGFTQ